MNRIFAARGIRGQTTIYSNKELIKGQHEFPFSDSSWVMGKAMTQHARFSFFLRQRLFG